MKKLFFTAAFIFVAQLSFAQDAFKADVVKLIQSSGAAGPMKVAKEQILVAVPEEKRAAFSKDFDATLPSLYEKMAKVYMEVYTHQDIKDMLKFYESPIGKKMAEKSGELSSKSMAAGQEWGMELQTAMMKYIQE
ncbi:DUF2059 domain-containing protein [Flavobacterium macacae]|uniref:DUF2059 domain-containing protein n=1 Tax=Flavobacterium macacae TaxID=2488993 RepID=A0A3P3W844_9FLAO|nr:DUF2059 domain-containing protein [Flavobacterium macacae]RRJ91150.1 DUF2059 domain-containing protein [Flavobacterium macacae]